MTPFFIICAIIGIACVIAVILHKTYGNIFDNTSDSKSVTLSRTNTAKVPANISNMHTFSLEFDFNPTLIGNDKRSKIWTLQSVLHNTNIVLEYRATITSYGNLKIVLMLLTKSLTDNSQVGHVLATLQTTNTINFNENNTFKFNVEPNILSITLNDVYTDVETTLFRSVVKSKPNILFRFFAGTIANVKVNDDNRSILIN